MLVDFNPEDRIVVYPYFTDTLLDLMRANPGFPPAMTKENNNHDATPGDFGIAYRQVGATPPDRGCTRGFHVAKSRKADRKRYGKSVRYVLVRAGVCICSWGWGPPVLTG